MVNLPECGFKSHHSMAMVHARTLLWASARRVKIVSGGTRWAAWVHQREESAHISRPANARKASHASGNTLLGGTNRLMAQCALTSHWASARRGRTASGVTQR